MYTYLIAPHKPIVNAERQAGYLLSDDHQGPGYVQGVGSVVVKLAHQMYAQQITHGYQQDGSKMLNIKSQATTFQCCNYLWTIRGSWVRITM